MPGSSYLCFQVCFGLKLSYFPVGLLKSRVPESRVPLESFCHLIKHACADPGIFVRGGPGQSDKKKLLTFFFVFF